MSKTSATPEDAQLVLRLYELRRDDELRKARAWYASEFLPDSFDDVKAVWFDSKHPHNAHFRMVTTYWDMAASFVVQGALNGDLLLESSTELIVIYAKVEPYLKEMREQSGLSGYLANIEKVIEQYPAAQEKLEWSKAFITRLKQQRAQAQAG
ncbi:MAG: hypothetical protein HY231_02065 [Acidobacteria bacterium]|nr:hypothetical protein [Acidobacteriota bacterium]